MDEKLKGKFIAIEGMDGAGTTTQTKLLTKFLSELGFSVFSSREPTTSPLGQAARKFLAMPIENNQYLLTALALCFAADRMEHVHTEILPSLKTHDFVLLDRYVMSSWVYQGLHLDTAWVKEINRFHRPADLTIVVDVDTDKALARVEKRAGHKEFFETHPIQQKIRARYRQFAEQTEACVLIDAHGSIDEVFNQIIEIIRGKFPNEKFSGIPS